MNAIRRNCRKLMLGLALASVLLLGSWNKAQAQVNGPPALVRAMNVPARVYQRTLPPWMWYNPWYSPWYTPYPYPLYPSYVPYAYPLPGAANAATGTAIGTLPSLPPLPAIPPVPPLPAVPGMAN